MLLNSSLVAIRSSLVRVRALFLEVRDRFRTYDTYLSALLILAA